MCEGCVKDLGNCIWCGDKATNVTTGVIDEAGRFGLNSYLSCDFCNRYVFSRLLSDKAESKPLDLDSVRQNSSQLRTAIRVVHRRKGLKAAVQKTDNWCFFCGEAQGTKRLFDHTRNNTSGFFLCDMCYTSVPGGLIEDKLAGRDITGEYRYQYKTYFKKLQDDLRALLKVTAAATESQVKERPEKESQTELNIQPYDEVSFLRSVMNYDHRAMAEYQVTIADLNSKLAAANAEIADLRENLCMSETTIKTLMHINCKNMEKINNLKKPNDSSKVFVLTDPQRNPEDILKIIDLPIPVHFLFNLYSCETTGCI